MKKNSIKHLFLSSLVLGLTPLQANYEDRLDEMDTYLNEIAAASNANAFKINKKVVETQDQLKALESKLEKQIKDLDKQIIENKGAITNDLRRSNLDVFETRKKLEALEGRIEKQIQNQAKDILSHKDDIGKLKEKLSLMSATVSPAKIVETPTAPQTPSIINEGFQNNGENLNPVITQDPFNADLNTSNLSFARSDNRGEQGEIIAESLLDSPKPEITALEKGPNVVVNPNIEDNFRMKKQSQSKALSKPEIPQGSKIAPAPKQQEPDPSSIFTNQEAQKYIDDIEKQTSGKRKSAITNKLREALKTKTHIESGVKDIFRAASEAAKKYLNGKAEFTPLKK